MRKPLSLAMVGAFFVVMMVSACAPHKTKPEPEQEPEFIKRYRKNGPPAYAGIPEYEDHHSFPPQFKGLKYSSTIPSIYKEGEPDTLTNKTFTNARQVALRDRKVLDSLGQRYVFITAGRRGPVPREKKDSDGKRDSTIALEFYSYDQNQAFSIYVANDRVSSIIPRRQGYQPPESTEEIAAAVKILQSDTRYERSIQGLEALGIFTPKPGDDRHLFLIFRKPRSSIDVFYATVNMTAGKVLEAGPAVIPERR